MTHALVVRRATPDDPLEGVAAIQADSFHQGWGLDVLRRDLRDQPASRLYLIEAQGGPLLGFCACWLIADELHINSLAVTPAMRRQGVAGRLLQEVLALAAADGATAATLEVRRSNVPALRLYDRRGFRVEAVRRNYYEHPTEDALILWLRELPRPVAGGKVPG